MADAMRHLNQAELRGKTVIQKIRDSEAGGMQSIKNEEYFHGYIPNKHTDVILKKYGDFLVRQAVKGELKGTVSGREQYVVSIRMGPSSYVRKEHDDWLRAWDRNGRDIASGEGRLVSMDDYQQMDILERDEYILADEGVHHFAIKYSRRVRLYYMFRFGFTHATGLIDYHKRHKIPVSSTDSKALLKRPVRREDWQYNHEQIDKVRRLGDGAFGEVFEGRLQLGLIHTAAVAVKTINGTVTAEENEKLFEEAMLMQRLDHPHVVRLFGIASNEEPVMIVMELAEGGSVLDAVRGKRGDHPTTLQQRINYVIGAAYGLQYLQLEKIVHRDLAARNTLIGRGDQAKISDFGLSITGGKKKEKKLSKVPTRYLAPQTLRHADYNMATDIWTFGIYIYEVFHNGPEELYAELSAEEVKAFVLSGKRLGVKADINVKYPEFLWKVTERCWKASYAQRLKIEEMITIFEEEDRSRNGGWFKRRFFGRWREVEFAQPKADGWTTDDLKQADEENELFVKALKKNKLREKQAIQKIQHLQDK